MFWPSIAKPRVVHFWVECCSFTGNLFLFFALWGLLNFFLSQIFSLHFLGAFPAWGANPGGVSVGSDPVRALCLLKQLQHTHKWSCSTQGWFDLAVFAHVIPSAPWESFPEPTLQEFIPTSVNENLLDSRIAPCQVAFQFVIFFFL